MALANGTIVGDYAILRPLGRGGMGEVYLARDAGLDRLVAIKTLVPAYGLAQNALERFQQEARAVAKLMHPNIVQVFRVDIESDPPYMAMEYVDGVTLDKLVAEKGRLSWQQAFTICGQVASALACAHEQGIIHRDIKLGNIMIDKKGRVRVTDFGLAKALHSDMRLTQPDQALGSPFYMSPEHWGHGEIVPASDLFSLGVAVFEMITGQLPFPGHTPHEVMAKVTSQPLPLVSSVDAAIPEVVHHFVATLAERRLERRYQSGHDVVEDLRALRDGKSMPHLSEIMELGTIQPVQSVPGIELHPPEAGESPLALVDDLLGEGTTPARVSTGPIVIQSGPDRSHLIIAALAGALIVAIGAAALIYYGREPSAPAANATTTAPPRAAEPPQPRLDGPPPRGPDGDVRRPTPNVDFARGEVAPVSLIADKQPLQWVQGPNQHQVPGVRDAAGHWVPAGITPEGNWVPMPRLPNDGNGPGANGGFRPGGGPGRGDGNSPPGRPGQNPRGPQPGGQPGGPPPQP